MIGDQIKQVQGHQKKQADHQHFFIDFNMGNKVVMAIALPLLHRSAK